MRSETDVTKAKDAGLPLPGGPQLLVLVKDQRVKEIRRQLAETEEIIRFVFPSDSYFRLTSTRRKAKHNIVCIRSGEWDERLPKEHASSVGMEPVNQQDKVEPPNLQAPTPGRPRKRKSVNETSASEKVLKKVSLLMSLLLITLVQPKVSAKTYVPQTQLEEAASVLPDNATESIKSVSIGDQLALGVEQMGESSPHTALPPSRVQEPLACDKTSLTLNPGSENVPVEESIATSQILPHLSEQSVRIVRSQTDLAHSRLFVFFFSLQQQTAVQASHPVVTIEGTIEATETEAIEYANTNEKEGAVEKLADEQPVALEEDKHTDGSSEELAEGKPVVAAPFAHLPTESRKTLKHSRVSSFEGLDATVLGKGNGRGEPREDDTHNHPFSVKSSEHT